MRYETIDANDSNKQFTWMEEGPLTVLLDPERRQRILRLGLKSKGKSSDKTLVGAMTGASGSNFEACLMCQK